MNDKPKFKVGDRVMIRPDLENRMYGLYGAVEDMVRLRGKYAVISRVLDDHIYGVSYKLKDEDWAWTDGMLLPMQEKKAIGSAEQKEMIENAAKLFDILGEIADG